MEGRLCDLPLQVLGFWGRKGGWKRMGLEGNMNMLLLLLSHFSRIRLCATPKMAATRLPRPWDSPGKNTGLGCHLLLQCTKVKSEREVAQSCPTLCDPTDCSLPGSSVHGIFQARVLEWGASQCFLRIWTCEHERWKNNFCWTQFLLLSQQLWVKPTEWSCHYPSVQILLLFSLGLPRGRVWHSGKGRG